MSTTGSTKINQLLTHVPQGVVLLSKWLIEQGYSADLQKRYKKGGWLKSIGYGALIRKNDQVGYDGAVYALQKQLHLSIHPGGRSALSLLGKGHYLELAQKKVQLFGEREEWLPNWFKNYGWDVEVDYYQSNFLPSDLGLTDSEQTGFTIKISGAARALMECLYLAPEKQELVECYELMEGLNNLRPDEVQFLLEACRSVKVKRLFLYMAEKAGHNWFKYVKTDNVMLGKGKRSLVKDGVYVPKYQITVPKNLEDNETSGL